MVLKGCFASLLVLLVGLGGLKIGLNIEVVAFVLEFWYGHWDGFLKAVLSASGFHACGVHGLLFQMGYTHIERVDYFRKAYTPHVHDDKNRDIKIRKSLKFHSSVTFRCEVLAATRAI